MMMSRKETDKTPHDTASINMDASDPMAVDEEDGLVKEGDAVVQFVTKSFRESKAARLGDESRWLKAYQNYRGIYSSNTKFTTTEKSRIFVKVTKTKVLAAYGQLIDVLFSSSKFPLTINPTQLPDGVAESVHINIDPNATDAVEPVVKAEPQRPYLLDPEKTLNPGDTMDDLESRMGPVAKKLSPMSDKVVEGQGTGPATVTYHPALIAAKNMEKKIHDQLGESGANKHLRSSVFETVLFGTGIIKGPFALDKEYPKWSSKGVYEPLLKTVPSCNFVSVWNFYPDPNATSIDDSEFTIERHKMSRSQLRGLKDRPFFMDGEIEKAIETGEDYVREYWETAMQDNAVSYTPSRFQVLEYWGYLDTEMLKEELQFDVPEEFKDKKQLNVNIWVCNNRVIRMTLNPFTPMRLPYQATPFEFNPYSFFGIGMAENMDDTQTMMNGFMRMAIDNAVLSGNLIFEIDEDALVPGQDLSVYPGKIFRRANGAPGQALFATEYPNVAAANLQLFDKARALADESSGFPSFAHGQTGVGANISRTASGTSMMMSAANGSIRTAIKNIDDYLLTPLGKGFFAFNMQFDFNEDIHGDLEVRAVGTESLMANEVRSQRLLQFLQVVSANPATAPFAKVDYIIRQIARSMELDPDKVTNSMQDAAIMSQILKKFNPPAQGKAGPLDPNAPQGPSQPQGQAPQPNVPMALPSPGQAPSGAPMGVSDTSGGGGGQMGIGTAPTPQEAGFSGQLPA